MTAIHAPCKVFAKPQPRQTGHGNGPTQSSVSDDRNLTPYFTNTPRGIGSPAPGPSAGTYHHPAPRPAVLTALPKALSGFLPPRNMKEETGLLTLERQVLPHHQLGYVSEALE